MGIKQFLVPLAHKSFGAYPVLIVPFSLPCPSTNLIKQKRLSLIPVTALSLNAAISYTWCVRSVYKTLQWSASNAWFSQRYRAYTQLKVRNFLLYLNRKGALQQQCYNIIIACMHAIPISTWILKELRTR